MRFDTIVALMIDRTNVQVCLQHMESLLYGSDYIIKFPDVQFLAFIKARQQDIFSMELSSLSNLVLSAFPGHGSNKVMEHKSHELINVI